MSTERPLGNISLPGILDSFIPVDLSPYVNSGPHTGPGGELRWNENGPLVRRWPSAQQPDLAGFPFGNQFFHGIPFQLIDPATNGGICWLALGRQPGVHPQMSINLPEPQHAASFIVAHFTDIESTEARFGELLASYTLLFTDGERAELPVRRRIEIAGRQGTIGTQGHAALPHVEYEPAYRAAPGLDSRAYFTGIETISRPQTFWLLVLENPFPDKQVVAIEATAHHPDLTVIGGITLSKASPNPLRRGPREGIIIDLSKLDEAQAQRHSLDECPQNIEFVPVAGEGNDDIALAVTLGCVTDYTILPSEPIDEWLTTPFRGWGAPTTTETNSLIYAQISAAREAHLLVRYKSSIFPFRWRDILESNSSVMRAAIEWTRVSVRILDAENDVELPTRVHFRGEHSEYLPPLGHTAVVDEAWGQNVGGDARLGRMSYAYVPGRFEIMLPVGTVGVEVAHGFEYKTARFKLDIRPDQNELTLKIEKWSNIREEGYFSGDVHVHFLDPVTAALEMAAEDLNVVNILAAQWGRAYTSISHRITNRYSGGAADRVIRIDSENRHHIMGDVFLLNLKEPILPLSSGGAERDQIGGWEETSLVDWCAAAKAQGGQVFAQLTPTPHAEVCAAVALGLVDAVEVRWFDFSFAAHMQTDGHWGESPFEFPGVQQWYAYLNAGYRLPAIGGTDKMSNAVTVGALRTYSYLGSGSTFDYDIWCAAIAKGRTFVSTGPTLVLNIDGKIPGDIIQIPSGGGQLSVTAVARAAQPFEVIDLVQNGEVIARANANPDGLSAHLQATVRVDGSSWLAARCYGRGKLYTQYPIDIAAHTSPIYVSVANQRQTSITHASYLLSLIEAGTAYLDKLAVWRNESHRLHHMARLDEGRQAILRYHPQARPSAFK